MMKAMAITATTLTLIKTFAGVTMRVSGLRYETQNQNTKQNIKP